MAIKPEYNAVAKVKKTNQGKVSPAREALRNISAIIKKKLQKGAMPPEFADCLSVNECLERMYRISTGQSDWSTFKGWKERGYSVRKGEKGFPLWSKPRAKDRDGENEKDAEDSENEKDGRKRDGFWVAYIFHAGQVADANGNAPQTSAPESFGGLLALPCDMRNDMATIGNDKIPTQLELQIA